MSKTMRGLARINKSKPKQVEWNQYIPGRTRARHRSLTFPSSALASTYCDQHNAKLTLGLVGQIIPIQFEEATREYLGSLGFLSKRTKYGYCLTLGLLGRTVAKDLMVEDIDGQIIDVYLARRQHAKASESTLAGDVRDLGAFFNWCIKRNYHDRNPLKLATRLPARKHRRQTPMMSFELIESIIKNLDTKDRRVACAFAAMRPIDRGVLAKLHAGQVNLDTGCVEFLRPKTARHNAEKIILPIPPCMVREFASRIASAGKQPLFRGLARARQRGVRNWWWRATSAAGSPDLLFRDLRKFAASYLQTVAPPAMVQHFLGHSAGDHSVMGEHYTQLVPEIAERIASLPVPGFPEHRQQLRIATA